MIVLKFGGSALADAGGISNVVNYIKNVQNRKPLVVVSAMRGVTDLLINTIEYAVKGDGENILSNIKLLKEGHEKAVADLIKSEKLKKEILEYFNEKFKELSLLLRNVLDLKECSPKVYACILSFGEKLSSRIISDTLLDQNIQAEQVLGEELIVTDSNFCSAHPDFSLSEKRIQKRVGKILDKKIVIVAGFIGANEQGETTTLGRGGSDLTASILAYCLNASEIWFLKEVDGIMTADPSIVTNSKPVEKMSYEEVAALSYLGAKVLHPSTIYPLREKQIPSFIKNVYKFNFKGTEIINNKDKNGVKAVTYFKNVGVVAINWQGMIDVAGIAARAAGSLAKAGINIIIQIGSEQNICFIINKSEQNKAVNALNREFEFEILKKKLEVVITEKNASIISVIGSGIRNNPEIVGKIFFALEKNNIDMKLISKDSSEFNISFVIDSQNTERALSCVHDEFFGE